MTVSLRSLHANEYEEWLARSLAGYARDMEEVGVEHDVAHAKGESDHRALLPDGVATVGQSLYALEEDGERVGDLWLAERDGDFGPTLFVFNVQILEHCRGRGLGRAAMELAEAEARRRGLTTITLNVFGGNEVARGLYKSLGFSELAVFMRKKL